MYLRKNGVPGSALLVDEAGYSDDLTGDLADDRYTHHGLQLELYHLLYLLLVCLVHKVYSVTIFYTKKIATIPC